MKESEFLKVIRVRRLDNLHRLFIESGLQQNEFAKKCGISPAQLNNYFNADKPLGESAARNIETSLGRPAMYLDFYGAPGFSETLDRDAMPRQLPLISVVQAGSWGDANNVYEPGEAYGYYFATEKHSNCSYCLKVVGDSMYSPGRRPSYHDGDIIVVDPEQSGDARNNSPVIARLLDDSLSMERRVTFKRLIIDGPTKYLAPLNPAYPIISEPFEVIGLVIQGIYT